jgi:hypothetical protein
VHEIWVAIVQYEQIDWLASEVDLHPARQRGQHERNYRRPPIKIQLL